MTHTETAAVRDVADVIRAQMLAALLDLEPTAVSEGALLRPMWHVGYLRPPLRQSEIGSDGHGLAEVPAPPRLGMRRMFAGGRLRLQPGIRLGERLRAETRVVSTRSKRGRSGSSHFVTTRTEVAGERGCLILKDERDIVYLEASSPRLSDMSAAAFGATPGDEVVVDPVLLFRFSSLTHNAHRIHYDLDYCREVEGYPALVVHGPLQALLMAEAATNQLAGPLGSVMPSNLYFEYRLVAPLFAGQGLFVGVEEGVDGVAVSVTDASGRPTARGFLSAGVASSD